MNGSAGESLPGLLLRRAHTVKGPGVKAAEKTLKLDLRSESRGEGEQDE